MREEHLIARARQQRQQLEAADRLRKEEIMTRVARRKAAKEEELQSQAAVHELNKKQRPLMICVELFSRMQLLKVSTPRS